MKWSFWIGCGLIALLWPLLTIEFDNGLNGQQRIFRRLSDRNAASQSCECPPQECGCVPEQVVCPPLYPAGQSNAFPGNGIIIGESKPGVGLSLNDRTMASPNYSQATPPSINSLPATPFSPNEITAPSGVTPGPQSVVAPQYSNGFEPLNQGLSNQTFQNFGDQPAISSLPPSAPTTAAPESSQANSAPAEPDPTASVPPIVSSSDASSSGFQRAESGDDLTSGLDLDSLDLSKLGGLDVARGSTPDPNMLGNFFGGASNRSFVSIAQFGTGQPGVAFNNSQGNLTSTNASNILRFGEGLNVNTINTGTNFPLLGSQVVNQLVVQAQSDGTLVQNPVVDGAAQAVGDQLYSGGQTVFNSEQSGVANVVQTGQGTASADFAYAYNYLIPVNIPSPGAGLTVGKVRLSDNNSARPQDRVFVDFNYFNNVPLFEETDVRRMTPGIERTFNNRLFGKGSIEARIPMAITLNSNVVTDGPNESDYTEFGNIHFTLKRVLKQNKYFVSTLGLGIDLPTADDFSLGLSDGTELVTVDNEALHLVPFLAFLYTPNDRFFAHAFFQFDFDVNGNATFINDDLVGPSTYAGRWHDPSQGFVDLSAGSWLFRNRRDRLLSGLAFMGELHYSAPMQDADVIQSGNFVVGNADSQVEVLDGTVGMHLQFRQNTAVSVGYSAPLTDDRVFDGEARLSINRYIGPRGRRTARR